MNQKEIHIHFEEYASIDELSAEDRELADEAIQAMQGAYAPYSHFHVGAAVRMSNGQIVRGANQENAAFPSGLCAERTAMFAAGARYPDKDMRSIAIAGGVHGRLGREPATPCGACRQVMAQYETKSAKPIKVILGGSDGIMVFHSVSDLLPFVFDSI
jgi:cytidine deaminase